MVSVQSVQSLNMLLRCLAAAHIPQEAILNFFFTEAQTWQSSYHSILACGLHGETILNSVKAYTTFWMEGGRVTDMVAPSPWLAQQLLRLPISHYVLSDGEGEGLEALLRRHQLKTPASA